MSLISVYRLKKNRCFDLRSLGPGQWWLQLTGPLGSIEETLTPRSIVMTNQGIFFATVSSLGSFLSRPRGSYQGLATGFYHELILRGIGYRYRFHRRGSVTSLSFKIGLGHRVLLPLKNSCHLRTNRRFDILLFGAAKAELRAYAETLRAIRPTDPYKGKGIKHYATPLKLKVGKVR